MGISIAGFGLITGFVGLVLMGLVFAGFWKVGSSNKTKAYAFTTLLTVIGLVGILSISNVFSGGFQSFMQKPLSLSTTPQPTPVVPPVPPKTTTTTTTTEIPADSQNTAVYLHDTYNPSTELTKDWIHVWQSDTSGWVDKGRYASGGTVKTAPGKTLMVAPADNSTNFNSDLKTVVVSSKGEDSIDFKVSGNATYAGLTFSVNNQDGSVNSGNALQAIAASQLKKMAWRIDAVADKSLGIPNGKIGYICPFNKTSFQSFKLNEDSGRVVEKSGILPRDFTIATTDSYNSFEMAAPFSDTDYIEGTAEVLADNANNPGTINITCYAVEQQVFTNADTGLPQIGYENTLYSYRGRQNILALNWSFQFS